MKLSEIKTIKEEVEHNKIFVKKKDKDEKFQWHLYWDRKADGDDQPFAAAMLALKHSGIGKEFIRFE